MLGSAIKSSLGHPVTTTVINRKLAPQGVSSVWLNGQQWNSSVQEPTLATSISLRNDSLPGSDLSYLFFEPTTLTLNREHRSGNWSDIGTSKGELKGEFFSALITQEETENHYAYSLLPNVSAAQMAKYREHPEVQLLRNDAKAQAISAPKLNLVAINSWSQGEESISDKLDTYTPMGLMIEQASPGNYRIAVNDPLRTQHYVSFKIKQTSMLNIESDPQKRVTLDANGLIQVDVSQLEGRGYSFILSNSL